MQDVIIESSNQSSSLAANVRKVTIKKSRGIFSYMFDWLIKGLLTASFAGRYPHEVSGGQCQRAAIAQIGRAHV